MIDGIYLDAWIVAAGIADNKKSWLFRGIRKGDGLTNNRMDTNDVLRMIKRRAKEASLPYSTCCHTFRATGITTYLYSGGTLEHAQQIAAHESPRADGSRQLLPLPLQAVHRMWPVPLQCIQSIFPLFSPTQNRMDTSP